MRVLGWVMAGALALTGSIGVQAASLGPSWYSMPNGWDGDWRRPSRQWNSGSVSPRGCPNCPPGGWGPHARLGVPTYWVWGPSGGAFEYPFADWRGPDGGWGNP